MHGKRREGIDRVTSSVVRAGVLVAVFLLAGTSAVPALRAQSRVRVTGGIGLAGGFGELGRLTGLGASGTLAAGFPIDERITVWIEGSADALPGADSGGDEEYMTRYLAVGEYRISWPWSEWGLSATLGAGATTFWDNSWTTYEAVNPGTPEESFITTVTSLTGTRFTVAPGFRGTYAMDPDLAVELVGRSSLAMYDGESFRIDASGLTELDPPGSPIVSWALTLGARIRTGGPPSRPIDLEPGDPVRVWGKSGDRIEGRLVSADRGRLRLSTRSGILDMAPEDVESAAALHSRAGKGALIGGVVLGALGFGLGYLAGAGLCDQADCSTEGLTAGIALGLVGGTGGLIFGGLIGSGSEAWRDFEIP